MNVAYIFGLLLKVGYMCAKIAYVDASRGLSGTSLLGALVAHGFPLIELQMNLATVLSPDYQIEAREIYEQGMHGMHGMRVSLPTDEPMLASSSEEWIQRIQSASLSEHVRERTLACLECLTRAEALITGREQQTLVLAAATIAEVLGVVVGLDALGIEQLFVAPLPLGTGVIQTARGIQSVPGPVTLEILRHVPARWQTSLLADAVVTPVGAAILVGCARFEPLTLTIEQVGYGFASEGGPLRICLGESVQAVPAEPLAELQSGEPLAELPSGESLADTDVVTVIESHLDTMTGELLGGLMERLFEAGALDVTYTPIQMKKNRPATLITVMCAPELGETLALLLLRETTTLGVRIQQTHRLKAQREQMEVTTPLGTMLVKIKRLGTQIISGAPEYEECRRIAHEHNIPLIDVYEVARHSIQNAII